MGRPTRERVREQLSLGVGTNEIAQTLRINPSTVCYHKARLGYPMKSRCGDRYDWGEIQRYYDEGHSARQCCKHFGCSAKAFHDATKRGAVVCRPQEMPLEELLILAPRSRRNIKERLLAAGIKHHRCENCGIDQWRDQPLSLCLHHVNGDRHDNRLENLQLLCPNCHSQTPNFGSKNKRALAA